MPAARTVTRLLSGAAFVAFSGQASAIEPGAPTPGADAAGVASAVGGLAVVAANQAPGTILQMPLIRAGRPQADISAEVFTDGRIRYERESLIAGLSRMIAPDARDRFVAALPPGPLLSADEVQQAGVLLRYDPTLLEVVVESIDPSLVPVEIIGGAFTAAEIPVTLEPQRFSAYLNVIGDLRLADFEDFEDPGVILQGAVRFDDFVLEFDGGYDPALTGDSGLYRRQARLVYDERDKARRWSAGDLQLFSSNLLGGVLMGGVGVERGRRIFTGLAPVQPLGPQQILMERDATVEVIVDGQQAETLQLMAGPYDLAGLLARYGGRSVQLFVTDVTGRRQLTGVDTFFDPIDLAAGEDEYSAGIGWLAQDFRAQPIYRGNPAFSGFYRRGITNRLILGAALQVSEDVQVVGLEMVASPRALPGRLELSGAVSTGDGNGFAVRSAYSVQAGQGAWARQFSISADYRSRDFATLADQIGLRRFETLNLTASFAQGLGERTTLVTGLNWFEREGLPTTKRAFADVVHRTRNFRITAGVEYGSGVFDREFGVRLAISVPLGPRTRAEAGYNSRREDFRAFVARSYDDRVGSFGYDLGVRRSPGSASVDGSAHYVGNRFFSRLTVSTAGPGFSDIDERQFARLQVGTSFAYAGGSFAIGRPIADSFVIARPHAALDGEQVVLGSSVHDRRFDAVSGTFGPALGPRLNSYIRQNIVYDLADGAQGYDIGTGIHHVEPAYRSGYKLVVGTDATVTAFGVLTLPAGPAELVSGTISGVDDPEFEAQPFFTNSAGRFAVIGLRPGRTYRVRLFDPQATFTIRVPADTDPLFRMGELAITPGSNGQE